MTPLDILLCRHGNTFNSGKEAVQVGAHTDLPLTEAGLEQAFTLGNAIRQFTGEKPVLVSSGPLQRQQQTALAIGQALSTDVQSKSWLNEFNFGHWEGLSTEAIKSVDQEGYGIWHTQGLLPNDLLGQNQLFQLPQALRKLAEQSSTKEPIHCMVSSQGTIRTTLSLIPQLWQQITSRGLAERWKVKTGHLCWLRFDGQSWSIMAWNQSPDALASLSLTPPSPSGISTH